MNYKNQCELTRALYADRHTPRIRNMKVAYEEIKAQDPQSSITYFSFRRDVIKGSIPSRKNGKRYLLNMQDVEDYYSLMA